MADTGAHTELFLLIILICVILYSFLTNVISKTVLTLPIIFVTLGYLFAPVADTVGPVEELRSSARLLAEITLVLVLFSDASHIRFSRLRMTFSIPLRMLIVGLPLTIALGTAVVMILSPEGGLALAFLTAAVLTPTDAALGQTVVSSPDVPERLGQSINVESGLNDGLVLPFVLLGAILASSTEAAAGALAQTAIIQVILGPLVGIAVGWLAARTLDLAQQRNWIIESAEGIVFLATAFVSYLASELVGGNGFIAAFVAGAVFGNTFRHDIHFISEFMEGAGQLLTMAAFLVFGALMLPDGLAHMTVPTVLIAVAFLTFVRMAPIWLSLAGTGLVLKEKLFLGWFGPRGLASVLFTLIMMDEFDLPNEEELLACVSITVALSVLLHGISASPLAKRIGGGAGDRG
ncbi:cation:proton antiporter [Sulfitobacter sp. F26169L]|uniref:cation:proton antiporter n=1 Tax=Sulfitobacter sp. F26169L TaxID=2996015 RepID=UPI002260FF79|nr:cation:proton antiporter [Sulfitobacter sp. F26169L]MCX7567639.1 cation:proton antiporter [Sulfitobacter sp. F26169L]